MNKQIVCAAVLALASTDLAGTTRFRQGTGQPETTPAPQKPADDVTVRPTTTLVGCLYREDQVPERTPNIAERAGILEDYILADAKTSSAQTQAGAPTATTGTSGSVPASGDMYKIEKIPDERLTSLVGKKVEVTGKINPERRPPGPGSATGAPTADKGLGPDRINLPELQASSIQKSPGHVPQLRHHENDHFAGRRYSGTATLGSWRPFSRAGITDQDDRSEHWHVWCVGEGPRTQRT